MLPFAGHWTVFMELAPGFIKYEFPLCSAIRKDFKWHCSNTFLWKRPWIWFIWGLTTYWSQWLSWLCFTSKEWKIEFLRELNFHISGEVKKENLLANNNYYYSAKILYQKKCHLCNCSGILTLMNLFHILSLDYHLFDGFLLVLDPASTGNDSMYAAMMKSVPGGSMPAVIIFVYQFIMNFSNKPA